ncbi:prickle-like protein 4 [Myotis yumanensis]|uniref:prickle-like protein 4 n=1 Tax=Myotis yumanensis TaxID=159337 RepID=UPI0038D061A9
MALLCLLPVRIHLSSQRQPLPKAPLRPNMTVGETLPSVSVLNPGWPHRGEGLTAGDADPPANFDSGPGHLPEEDLAETSAQERYCLALGEEELAELWLFCAQRRREAQGQGVVCLIPPKLQECTCEKACFACQACGQALMNRIYFDHDGHLYCGRHHAELLRLHCPACDQLIFSPRCTEAEGWRWHENHFCCQDCAGPLGGGRYAWPGGGPCCPTCFESRYSDAGWSLAATLEGRPPLDKGGKQRPRPPTAPPNPSFGARSSHHASLAGALRGPPEPIPRRG